MVPLRTGETGRESWRFTNIYIAENRRKPRRLRFVAVQVMRTEWRARNVIPEFRGERNIRDPGAASTGLVSWVPALGPTPEAGMTDNSNAALLWITQP